MALPNATNKRVVNFVSVHSRPNNDGSSSSAAAPLSLKPGNRLDRPSIPSLGSNKGSLGEPNAANRAKIGRRLNKIPDDLEASGATGDAAPGIRAGVAMVQQQQQRRPLVGRRVADAVTQT